MSRIDVPIEQLSFAQKLNLLEMLWADLAGNDKELDAPDWHKTVLDDREAALNAGEETLSDWRDARERIRKNVT